MNLIKLLHRIESIQKEIELIKYEIEVELTYQPPKKLTKKQQIEASAKELVAKWKTRDRKKAEKKFKNELDEIERLKEKLSAIENSV